MTMQHALLASLLLVATPALSQPQQPVARGSFILHTGTPLVETGSEFQFLVASNNDLFAIKKRNTGSHSTEVHVLSADSHYQTFILHTGTPIEETDDSFVFGLAYNRDLVAIKKNHTATHSTEIHILSAASNYQTFTVQTGTPLQETDSTFEFAVASNYDVFAIKKQNTGTHSTEVHVLSALGHYQQFSLHTGTALQETNGSFAFALTPGRDLVAIKKSGTGTHSTEVHLLSGATNYQTFSFHTGTALEETDNTYEFGLTRFRDLLVVKKSRTGSHSTEVHVISLQ